MAAQGVRETPLLRKYAGEPQEVVDHLQVFAIEEVAYAAAGRERDLEDMKTFESHLLKARMFGRSRDIVRAEGAGAFVAELRGE
jgi:CRISPR/Cas system-associated protein Cas5 (RAMP superfamily)